MPLVSKSEYARLKGRSPGAISQWISQGIIPQSALEGSGQRARIDVEKADAAIAQRLAPGQQQSKARPANMAPARNGAAMSAADDLLIKQRRAMAAKATYEAEAARRKLMAEEGKWIDAEEAMREFKKIFAREIASTDQFVTHILPQAIEALWPGKTWKEISAIFKAELREFRQSRADETRRLAADQRAKASPGEAVSA